MVSATSVVTCVSDICAALGASSVADIETPTWRERCFNMSKGWVVGALHKMQGLTCIVYTVQHQLKHLYVWSVPASLKKQNVWLTDTHWNLINSVLLFPQTRAQNIITWCNGEVLVFLLLLSLDPTNWPLTSSSMPDKRSFICNSQLDC